MFRRREVACSNRRIIFVLVALLGLAAGTATAAAPGKPVSLLTGPNTGNPLAIARGYLEQNKQSLGLSSRDIAGALVTDQYTSSHNGVTHIYLRQQYQGIEVHSANININIAADGSVINIGNRFVPDIGTAVNTTTPFLNRGEAISAAAYSLGRDPARGAVSRNPIAPRLVFQPVAKGIVRLAWELEIYTLDAQNWWSMRVDAITGAVLDQKNYVTRDSYKVFALPVESPNHAVGGGTDKRDDVDVPANAIASPSGWLNGTCTKGNNADAYLDINNSNSPTNGDSDRACDTGLNFSFPADFNQDPSTYRDAAVTNLFYWNNLIHDVFYQYGFDEAAGNFQENNGGKGGAGSDSVNAEAQDGGGTNNANFATPPDGNNPRMQMYLWNLSNPDRDGDFDNGIVIHEYGHGISVRLTGGPGTSSCLSNTEQGGEGWSDFFAMLMTIESGDAGTDRRGVGTYALGEPTNGDGIRDYPYSTDMSVDPRTYDAIKTAAVPHGVGSTWAAMLWEMTWALIGQYGFDADLYNGIGGNNIALQLVVDGLKLQSCSPGFVDARNAILLADQNNNGGANQCLIWESFSKRGLGYSADQGSSSNRGDGVQAFDLPPVCQEILSVAVTANPEPVDAGQNLTYSLLVDNNTTGSLTSLTATSDVPALAGYVAGSATCGGSESAGIVTFPLGTLNSGTSTSCEFQVAVNLSASSELLSDDMENGAGLWAVSSGVGNDNWSLNTSAPHSPTTAWFAADIARSTDQYLTLANSVSISGDSVLRFWHSYDTEAAWDGGVVEISVNGGAWTDLGNDMFQNGYNSTINVNPDSPISGRRGFSGNSGGYVETLVDLGSYADGSNTARIRFRMATDGLVGGVGWYVDDVEILDDALLSSQTCVSAAESDSDCTTVKTFIVPVDGPAVPRIAVSPLSLSATQDPGVTTVQTLAIDNNGGAVLDWSIGWASGGNCAALDGGNSWVSASAAAGSLAAATGTTVDVTFNSTGLATGYTDTGALCVSSNDGDTPRITVDLSIAVNDPDATVDVVATSELPGTGVVTGRYNDTQTDGGFIQEITEQHQGGKPADRHDGLEHTWVFQLQSGSGLKINANAWVIEPISEGDEIRLYYSSDNSNYNWFYTVTSSSSANDISAAIADQEPGPFYIRAIDGDRTPKNNNNATFYVDYLSVTEGGTSQPPPTSTTNMTILQPEDRSEPGNRNNRWNAVVGVRVVEYEATTSGVEGARVIGNWSKGATGSDECTTDIEGWCEFRKQNLRRNSVTAVDFTVTAVTRGPDDTYTVPSTTTVTLTAP
jgi:hypothetical protein